MKILGRIACLGSWVLSAKFNTIGMSCLNQQKVRCDLYLDYINGNLKKPLANLVRPFLDRLDIYGMIAQQEELKWERHILKNPELIIMDSFAELVDQKFVHKDGWGFCCYYSDLNHSKKNSNLICKGLLSEDKIYETYDNFFTYVRSRTSCPIVFIHFPTTLEMREIYINQGKAITSAMDLLHSKFNIQNIHADEDAIEQDASGNVYHFTQKTVQNIAEKIKL